MSFHSRDFEAASRVFCGHEKVNADIDLLAVAPDASNFGGDGHFGAIPQGKSYGGFGIDISGLDRLPAVDNPKDGDGVIVELVLWVSSRAQNHVFALQNRPDDVIARLLLIGHNPDGNKLAVVRSRHDCPAIVRGFIEGDILPPVIACPLAFWALSSSAFLRRLISGMRAAAAAKRAIAVRNSKENPIELLPYNALNNAPMRARVNQQRGTCPAAGICTLHILRRSQLRPKSAVLPISSSGLEPMAGRMEPRKRTAPCSVKHDAVAQALCVRLQRIAPSESGLTEPYGGSR